MGRLKVLVADGSPVYKKLFAKAVAELDKNTTVVYVADGNEALEKIRRSDYDAVVIDAEISGLGMSELFSKIMQTTPKAQV